MLLKQGFTLMEMIVVLIIIAVCAALAFPNFNSSMEQARASNAQNNLLAIYSAQQNYRNNNGNFATGSPLANSLAEINSTFSLNIQDDGSYSYSCAVGPPPICTAIRNNSTLLPEFQLTLNQATQLHVAAPNPSCTSTNNPGWCP